jgi:hypothetical protein
MDSIKSAKELLAAYTAKYRARLMLSVNCDLLCVTCPDAVFMDCWITNIDKLAKDFPTKISGLSTCMSSYTLALLLARMTGENVNELITQQKSVIQNRVIENLKPIESTENTPVINNTDDIKRDFVFPVRFWYTNYFYNLNSLQKLVLLELIAETCKLETTEIFVNIEYISRKYNSQPSSISAMINMFESLGFLIKQDGVGVYKVNISKLNKLN